MIYREPNCYELAGKTVQYRDGSVCFSLSSCRMNGGAPIPYLCQKAADDLYAVQAGERLLVIDTALNQAASLPIDAQTPLEAGAFAVTTVLASHTLSFLAAPGVRFRHSFHDERALHVRGDWVLTRFCQNGASYAVLLDTHLLRAVGACARAGKTQACALYATYIRHDGDDALDYRVHKLYQKLYNPLSSAPMCGGLKQYISPVSEEWAGRAFHAVMEDGAALTLRCAERLVTLNGKTLPYVAVKCDDDAHMALITDGERAVTVLVDEQSGGVALISAALDESSPLERQVRYTVSLGTLEGRAGRPERTEELTGRRIIWTYNPNDEIMHSYPRSDLFRLGHWEGVPSQTPDEGERRTLAWLAERKEKYPCYEEPAVYVKMRDGLYLYCILEQNVHARLPEQGGNLLIVALNTNLMRYSGRCFGRDGQLRVEDMRIGAVGREYAGRDETDDAPIPYYPLASRP